MSGALGPTVSLHVMSHVAAGIFSTLHALSMDSDPRSRTRFTAVSASEN